MATKRPLSVVVGGLTFTVEERGRDEIAGGDMGGANFRNQIIAISDQQHAEQARDTLLHEIVHMILRIADLTGHKADERFVNVFTTMLIDTLRRNPELVPYIVGPA